MSIFDVIVLGGGSGGYPAAVRAAELGLRVAVVEGEKLGGVCLHRGCIPTKSLLHAAKTRRAIAGAAAVGFDLTLGAVDFSRIARNRDESVNKLFRGVQGLLRRHRVEVIEGWGQLTGQGSLEVRDAHGNHVTDLRATDIILATGSRPRSVPGLPFDGVRILSSDHAVAATTFPKSVIILGSGAIGSEFASLYADLGLTDVTLVEMLPRVLPMEDADIGIEMEKRLQQRGVTVLTSAQVAATSVSIADDGIVCSVEQEGKVVEISAEVMLLAIGREANTASIGLEQAGVKLSRGFIAVDRYQRTNVPHLYAVGDVTGGLLLAHKATAEGLVAAEAIAGLNPPPINPNLIPRCTYSYPEVASFGLTEVEALSAGHEVRVGRYPMSANARAVLEDEQIGFVKVVVDAQSQEILGMHAIGNNVTELIAGPILAGGLEATSIEIGRSVHPHPTYSEAFAEAALAAAGSAYGP